MRRERERPILFSAPMVLALLSGSKTQTRRVVKGCAAPAPCPYGQRGDLLWVRENIWRRSYYGPDGEVVRGTDAARDVRYWATDSVPEHDEQEEFWEPRSSIFCPRFASRLTLRIVDVRTEALQDITEEDARAEGVMSLPGRHPIACARSVYEELWDEINGERAPWAANPRVWVVEFRRVK